MDGRDEKSRRYSIRIQNRHIEAVDWAVNELGLPPTRVLSLAAMVGLRAIKRLVEPESALSPATFETMIGEILKSYQVDLE